jgi:hypothetical protein
MDLDPRADEHRRLNLLATWLGWGELEYGATDSPDMPKVEWYEARKPHGVAFQINVQPVFGVAVYALRYRLVSGWHPFHLSTIDDHILAEAWRLDQFVAYDWFRTIERRAQFRRRFPECKGWTAKRVKRDFAPYIVVPEE